MFFLLPVLFFSFIIKEHKCEFHFDPLPIMHKKIALLNQLWYSLINDNFNIFKPPSKIAFIIFIDLINIARNPWLKHVENGASNCYVLKNVSTRPLSNFENNFSNRSTNCHINVSTSKHQQIYSQFYKAINSKLCYDIVQHLVLIF